MDDYVEDYEDSSYDADGKLTPKGLARWFDDEGGVFSFIQGRGVLDLIDAGVNHLVAIRCLEAMEALKADLIRIGVVL